MTTGRRRGKAANMAMVSAADAPRRWTATRVAHPVRDLESSAAFYRDVLGLVPQGGFGGHDGYDGRFFAPRRTWSSPACRRFPR
jgi:hypothetical protein